MSIVRPRDPLITEQEPVKRRNWRKIGLLGFLILGLIAAGLGTGLYKYAYEKIRGTNDGDIVLPPGYKKQANILIIGSDSREGLNKAEKAQPAFYPSGGKRSDTIILVHLFGDGKHAVVLSFPRDLRVEVPGFGRTKINAAYNLGPNNVIKTVEDYSGLKINNYVEVNFVAFREIVDSLGGVEMCTTRAYHDPEANLFIKKPGCHDFDGDMALGWARSRKTEPDGDFGRIRRQQQLIRVALEKVMSAGLILKPWKLVRVINAAAEGLKTDSKFNVKFAMRLAGRLKDAGEGNPLVDFRIVPSQTAFIGGVSYVVAKDAEAQALFDAIKADRFPLPDFGKTSFSIPEPKDVTVRVVDASGREGAAKDLADALDKAGFRVLSLRSGKTQSRTQIFFRPGDELKAQLVHEDVAGAQVVSGTSGGARADPDADVTVVVGSAPQKT